MATSLNRFRTVFTGLQGSPYLSTHYFDPATGTPQDQADALADFWHAVDDVQSVDQSWKIEDEYAIIDTATGQATGFGNVTGDTGTGSASDERLPTSQQVLLKWATGVVSNGRRIVGHTFVPGLTQVSNDNGNVLAATQSAILTAGVALVNDTSSILEVWARSAGVGESVNGVAVAPFFAVLRSRRD